MSASRRALLWDGARRAVVHLPAWFLLVLFSFMQQPGRATFDTKLDLTADPGGFLERALHLWSPELSFGELQNQAYGYFFPQGGYFWLTAGLGIPDWVSQRIWSALVLVLAYEGARRLYAALAPGSAVPVRVVAGLAYALSPRLLGLSGVLTAEVLPTAVLPWAVLPLVLALRGRLTPMQGGLLSGVALLGTGGVNATENLAALPLPALLLVCALGASAGRRLAGWWVLAVSAACAWWFLPLLVLGRYSPPFLDYIETAAATTRPLGWTNVTRGADHWVAFVWTGGGQPWWPGAYALATDPWLVAIAGIVAALSLAGLFRSDMPGRLPLALSVLLGFVLLTLGRVHDLGSPLSPMVQGWLDGSLAALRNVHKVDPIVRLPLALGLAHAVGVLASRATELRVRRTSPRPLAGGVVALVVVTLLLSAQPLFTADLRKAGWERIPSAWTDAAGYLEQHAGTTRTLVLPGAGFAQQSWGHTIDEPMQGVGRSPWVVRSQVPLSPGQTTRFLDAIEERIQDGRGSAALAAALRRAGIGHVLLRRDLDRTVTDTVDPHRVESALSRSPGVRHVATFGDGADGPESVIDLYEVAGVVRSVEAVHVDDLRTLAGGPEDVVTALESGVLPPDVPTVNADETGWDATADLVADGFRKRERQFGRAFDAEGAMMTLDEEYRTERRVHDYPGVAEERRAVTRYADVAVVTASSSDGYVDSLGAVRPELAPHAAIDGLTETSWRSATYERPVGQWIEVRLKEPVPLDSVRVHAGIDGFAGIPVRRIRVDAGERSSVHDVDPGTGIVDVRLDGAPVDRIRVGVEAVLGDPDSGVVAIHEIELPGVDVERTLVLPEASGDPDTAYVFRARPHVRACVDVGAGPSCDLGTSRPSEEEHGLNRLFTTHGGDRYTLSGEAVARATPEAADLLAPLPGRVAARASSVLAGEPAVSGQFAVDGDPATRWIARQGDGTPTLTLSWETARTLSRIWIETPPGVGSRPTTAVIEGGGERRVVDLAQQSLGYFEPLRARRARISFPTDGSAPQRPLAIGELHLEGIEDLKTPVDPARRTGAVCGWGPEVVVGGQRLPTRVDGTVGDVVAGLPMRWTTCSAESLALGAGEQRLSITATPAFSASAAVLAPERAEPGSAVGRREVQVHRWTATSRTIEVAPGPRSVIRVPENVNDGWRASLDGRELEPLRIDGWQQGYLLPAGIGGQVTLVFTPDTRYRSLLVAGAAAGAGLVLVTGIVLLRRGRGRAHGRAGETSEPPWPTALSGRWLMLGWPVLGYLLGGVAPAAGILVGAWLRARARARDMVPVGAALVGGSALLMVGVGAAGRASHPVADAVAGLGVGLLSVSLLRARDEVETDD